MISSSAYGTDGVVALLGQADRASAARSDLLDPAQHLVVQLVAPSGRYDAQHRHALVDERDRPVLELPCSEALGVQVGQLLQLQGALEGDRVAGVPAEEQHGPGVDVLPREGVDRLVLVQDRLDVVGHRLELVEHVRDLLAVPRALHLGEVEREQVAGHQLGQEALGRGDADLRAGVGVDHRVGLARDGGAVGVADGEHPGPLRAGVPDRLQRVRGLAGLADRHHQRRVGEDRVAVAELRRQLDLDGDPRPVLDGVLRDHPRVERRAARDDDDLVDVAEVLVRQAHLVELQLAVLPAPAEQRVGDGARLLVDLLAHEPVVAVLLGGRQVPVDVVRRALRRRPVEVGDGHALAGDRDDLVLAELHAPRACAR